MSNIFQRVVATLLFVASLFLVNAVACADPQEDQKHREEVQRYTEQIKQNPNDANAYFKRGNAYSFLGQKEQAIRDYNKVIELNPNWSSAPYANMGGCFADLGQNYLAIDACNKALALDPNEGTAYGNRSLAYANLGQYDQAIQDADKTIALGPTVWAYNNRGRIYYDLKQYERAIADFDKALELDPNYDKAYNNRETCQRAIDEERKKKDQAVNAR